MCDYVVCTFEEFDILFNVFQVKRLFSFHEQTQFSLDSINPFGFRVEFYNFFFASFHPSIEFIQIWLVQAEFHLVGVNYVVKLVASKLKFFGMVNDNNIKFPHFIYKCVTLGPISVFKLAQLIHNFMCVRAKIVENVCLNLIGLFDLIHSWFDSFVFVIDFVFKDLSVCIALRNSEVELLEHIQLVVCVENRVFELFNLFSSFLTVSFNLVNGVFIGYKPVHNGVK